jgi:hypothetical protein
MGAITGVLAQVAMTAAGITGKTLLSMVTALMTDRFIKTVVVSILEQRVKRTKTEEDDKLLVEAKKHWGME